MSREDHEFEFSAVVIAEAAGAEAKYHEDRIAYWNDEFEKSYRRVEETLGAKIQQMYVTGGRRYDVVVDYGDPAAHRRLNEATEKIETHREAAEKYRSDEKVYGSQNGRMYELSASDVHYFRLGGGERED